MINEREKAIVQYILANEPTTISKIATHMKLSDKTVSQALKQIDKFFTETSIQLVRKPRVGVSFVGDPAEIVRRLELNNEMRLPITKKDRVQFLCFEILKYKTYFTRQKLQDTLFISKSTLENDMNQVNEIFHHFNVNIDVLPGKGSFLNLSEQEKRSLAFDLIYYFWGDNWKITKKEHQYLHSIQGVPPFVNELMDMSNITLVDTLLQSYLKQTQLTLSDSAYHSLLLHLIIMIDRVRENNYLKVNKGQEVVTKNRAFDSFIASLERTFELSLPESEIHYICLHMEGTSLIQNGCDEDIESILRHMIQKNVTVYNEGFFLALIAHIKESMQRIQNGLLIHNPFLTDVKINFPIAFEEALQLGKVLNEHFDLQIPESEVAFLAVHIQTMKEHKEEKCEKKVRVLLVCSSGKGTSQLLAARIRKNFQRIEISRILSIQELMKTTIYEDLVLSTVILKLDTIPTIHVSPILNKEEQLKIDRFLEKKLSKHTKVKSPFSKLITDEFIFLDLSFNEYSQVIRFIGNHLIRKKYAKEGIVESSLKREQLSFTSFEKFATPHGSPEYVMKSVIVFVRLANEIPWGETKVRYLFFICIKDKTGQELEQVYDRMLEVMESGERKYLLKGTKQEIKNYLKEER
ncbi:transcription antiterminator [Enterococcus hirae]|nr:transcription antiterminator [Enterococcus hirae]